MTAALELREVTAGYSGIPALRGISMDLAAGEVVALIGPNGAGKSTVLRSIVGAIRPMSGTIQSFGSPLVGRKVEHVARLGITLVPDDRGVFPDLTVREHLRLADTSAKGSDTAEVLEWFPKLREVLRRRCGLLSGGEQQMLGLAKALLAKPNVLMVDEMSLGLAPIVVQDLLPIIRRLADDRRMAVLLVEQHLHLALSIADRGVILNRGEIVLEGRSESLLADPDGIQRAYFGEAAATGR